MVKNNSKDLSMDLSFGCVTTVFIDSSFYT
jgi:hypothetical protein